MADLYEQGHSRLTPRPRGPSVLVVNSNVVVIAWIGTDPKHTVNVMYDAYGARKKVTLADTSGLRQA